MKFKIVILTCFCILINSTLGYCEEVVDEKLIANHVSEIVSDDGNIYFDEYGRVTRSATGVAIAGSVASTILSLAVKAGIVFGSVKGMDEFLHRFLNIPESESVIKAIGEKALSSVGGLIELGRDLLSSIGDVFNQLHVTRNYQTISLAGINFPYILSGNLSSDLTYKLYTLSSGGLYVSPTNPDAEKTFTVEGVTYRMTLQSYKSALGSYNLYGEMYKGSTRIGKVSISTQGIGYMFPYLYGSETNPYIAIGMVYKENANERWSYATFYDTDTRIFPQSTQFIQYGVDTQIGSAWSDGAIKGDDGTTNSNVSIKVPTDLGVLVGDKGSDSVSSSPTYDYWIPGKPVTYPSTDDVTTSPPRVDIVVPDTETDIPDVDNPSPPTEDDSGDSSLWDWLKKLIQKIIDLITSIWNWLTTFWERLLEFLLSLIQQLFFVEETYWSDKVTDLSTELEGKYPTVNIDKIKDIAVGEKEFKDIKATFFGVEGVVVRASLINRVISWARPILQGFIALFLLLYNYSTTITNYICKSTKSTHKRRCNR